MDKNQLLSIVQFLVALVETVTKATPNANPLNAFGGNGGHTTSSLLEKFAADSGGKLVLQILRDTAALGDIGILTKVAEALIVLATQVNVTMLQGQFGPMVIGNAFAHAETKPLEVKLTGSLKTSPKGHPTAHMDVPSPKSASTTVGNNPLNGLGVQAPQTQAGANAGFQEALSKLSSFFPNS